MTFARILSLIALAGLIASASPSTALAQQTNQGPAYLVVELNVKDKAEFDKGYGSQAGAIVQQHGGTFIVGGETPQALEGSKPQGAVIIVRFPSMQQAQAFLNSPEYKKIIPVRQKTADTRSYLVQGASAQ
jgi:uncharacterized protein (DUF1330 family)